MKAKRCEQGHFYDANKYMECPYCHEELRTSVITAGNSSFSPESGKTAVASYNIDKANAEESEKTRIVFEAQGFKKEPAAGWLVCIKGPDKGRDFRFFNGQNTIGRGQSCRIILADRKISRQQPAASVLYDARNMVYYISCEASDAGMIVYLNGKAVFDLTELSAYDSISIGDTELLFIPLCTDEFSWSYK